MLVSVVIDGRTGLELLGRQECLELLSQAVVGRLGVIIDSHPEVYPINLAVHDRSVVFLTDPGPKLTAAITHGEVAVEIDGTDAEAKTGWSVLVVGPARTVHDAETIASFDKLGIEPWAPGDKNIWVEVRPRRVSGRRILPHDESSSR